MNSMPNDQEKLKELKNKADKLNNAAIRLNADIDNAQENLERYLKQALEEFGTDSVEELEKILAQTQAKNAAVINKIEKEIEVLTEEISSKQAAIQKIKSGS